MKNNRGAFTVEMCLIMPLVICAVFLIINLYMAMIRESSLVSESYMKLYLGDAEECSVVHTSGKKANKTYKNRQFNEVSMELFGMWLLVAENRLQRHIKAEREIRDIGRTLWRWQLSEQFHNT